MKTMEEYKRERYHNLSVDARGLLQKDREYYAYISMMWERDYWKEQYDILNQTHAKEMTGDFS